MITAVNGKPVDDVNTFRLQVAGFAPGTKVDLKVDRNGQNLDVPVTLGEFNLEAENKGGQGGNVPSGGEKGALQRRFGSGVDAGSSPANCSCRRGPRA